MLAAKSTKPLIICNLGLSVQTSLFLKNKIITGSVKTTVKKYLAQVICNTGRSELRYFAKPSITGSITHASKLKIMAFIRQ